MEVMFDVDVEVFENENFETNAHLEMSFGGVREWGDTNMPLWVTELWNLAGS